MSGVRDGDFSIWNIDASVRGRETAKSSEMENTAIAAVLIVAIMNFQLFLMS